MKKLLSIVLALSMALSAAGVTAAAEEPVPTTSQDIYGWIEETPYSNAESGIYDTVNVVEDTTYGKALEFIKQTDKNTSKRLMISQNISPSKLITGHTYTFEFAYNVPETTDRFWISGGFSSYDNSMRVQPTSMDNSGKGWQNAFISLDYTTGKDWFICLLVQEIAKIQNSRC